MYELVLSEDANLSPYIGQQLTDAGFWNHQNNWIHTVRDEKAQAWANTFDWLSDAKIRCKNEIITKVHDILTLTPEQIVQHRIYTHAESEPDTTFYLVENNQYVQKSGTDTAALLTNHKVYEQKIHQFAHNLIVKLNMVTTMQELRNVREIEGHSENWPQA